MRQGVLGPRPPPGGSRRVLEGLSERSVTSSSPWFSKNDRRRQKRAATRVYKCGPKPGRLRVTCAPPMAVPATLFGHPKLVLHSGPMRFPGGTLPGSQNGARSAPGASRERNGRHRVDPGIYLLRSTSAGRIWAQNGSRKGPRSDIGLRLAPTPEK